MRGQLNGIHLKHCNSITRTANSFRYSLSFDWGAQQIISSIYVEMIRMWFYRILLTSWHWNISQINNGSVNRLFQPDVTLDNDGSSGPQIRGRGQQKSLASSGNREPVGLIATNGEFGKKTRVTEYYNSQEQQAPNVRVRNQFAAAQSVTKDTNERDNNRITQFGSREQQPPR